MVDHIKKQQDETIPLREFLKLPQTVDFNAWYSPAFRQYIADKPYIRLGTLFGNGNAVLYAPMDRMDKIFADLGYDYFNIYPQVYGLLGEEEQDASGITWVHDQPYLNLRGQGVVLGFVDTGIDYTKPTFQYEDGTTRIHAIWDQTLDGTTPEAMQFGAVFTKEQINAALQSERPLEVVPHQDDSGHGTFLASVAGGRGTGASAGAAPDAEIVMVKLRKASAYYLEKYLVPPDQEHAFESTDIMMGIKFIYDQAQAIGAPAAICIGLGNSFGGHNGNNKLESYIDFLANSPGIAFCVAGGNEGNARHHTQGRLANGTDDQDIDVQVGEGARDMNVNISYQGYDTIAVSLRSPTGETTGRIPFDVGAVYHKKLLLENAMVSIYYHEDVNRFAVVQVRDITPGIWKITLHGTIVVSGEYDAWLPVIGLTSPHVEFSAPSPDRTITIPSTAFGAICVTAYDQKDGSLYINNSWGPTASGRIAPDFTAPGVDVKGIFPSGEGTMSGTSVAAAVTTGASALMFQWGIVNKNEISMNGHRLRTLLIRGCKRESGMTYPNNRWGYGKLNMEETIRIIREE